MESNAAFYPSCRFQRRPNSSWNGDLDLLATTYKPPFVRLQASSFKNQVLPRPLYSLMADSTKTTQTNTTKGDPKVSNKVGLVLLTGV